MHRASSSGQSPAVQDLCTIYDLENSATQRLSSINTITFEYCLLRMAEIAKDRNIQKPLLCLGIQYNAKAPFVTQRILHVVNSRAWERIQKQADEHKLAYMPVAFIIDGSKFRPSQS